jgi:small ligand-binding sensory domain FIST
VPFASARSEHPVASQATGEVAGTVLEAIGERPDLVVVTVSRPHAGALEDIAGTVAAVLHPLAMIGCAAESVVGASLSLEGLPAIGLWAGRVGPLVPVRLEATRRADDSWHFSGWPGRMPFDPRALLLIADPFTFPTDEFLAWLAQTAPDLPVVGGTASAGRGTGGSRLVAGAAVVTTGATGVLVGGGVDIEAVVAQGCRGYGQALTVTRSDGNVIYEVAGLPAMECLVDQITQGLGPGDIAGMGTDGLLIGRLIDEFVDEPGPGDYLVRRLVGVDRSNGAVAVEDRVPVGSTIRFHVRGGRAARHELETLLGGRQAEGALVFAGHRPASPELDGHLHPTALLQRALGPVSVTGFTTAGSIGPVGGHNFVHGFTTSVALFRDH